MAINDDDKKFIKNTINDALSNFEAKTESKRKLFDLKRQEEDKKAREEYLKELKERDAKGEATIAQKFEMLKLSVDNAIPEDLKDAWSGSKQAIGKGANQLGKGLSTINKKIMMSNPLTAMLYNNRDLFGAGFNIAAGGLKMGWGALKGLGTGAAGLLNAAINSKKKNEETEEQDEEEKPKFIPLLSGKSAATNVLNEKQQWQEQIQDIHKVIVKQNNEQKKSNETMSKGLSGLGKTMEAVKGFVDLIQQKQKLIVAGVLLAAVAILGLAAWFKGGKWKDLFKNPMDNVVGDSFKNFDAHQDAQFKMDAYGSALSNFTGKEQQTLFNKKPQLLTGISSSTVTKSKALDGQGNSIDLTEIKFKTGELTPVLAPYDGMVSKLNKQTNKSQGKVVNTRWVMIITPKETEKYPVLKLKNLTSPQFRPNVTFKKGDILAYASSDFSMENFYGFENDKMNNIGDYQSFVNEADQNDYKENLQRLADTKTEEENKKLDDFMYHKSRDSYYNQKHEGEGWAQKGVNWFHDPFHKKEEDINYNNYAAARNEGKNQFLKYYNTGEKEDIQPVDVTTNIASKSSKKAQEQTQTLKEQELNKQAEKASIEPQPQEETTPQFTQVFSDNDDYNYSYSDIGLSQRQYDAMTNNSINLSGVN